MTEIVIPVGGIIEWLGTTTAPLPIGWLLDGSTVNIQEYIELYNVLKDQVDLQSTGELFTLPSTARTVGSNTIRGLFKAKR